MNSDVRSGTDRSLFGTLLRVCSFLKANLFDSILRFKRSLSFSKFLLHSSVKGFAIFLVREEN